MLRPSIAIVAGAASVGYLLRAAGRAERLPAASGQRDAEHRRAGHRHGRRLGVQGLMGEEREDRGDQDRHRPPELVPVLDRARGIELEQALGENHHLLGLPMKLRGHVRRLAWQVAPAGQQLAETDQERQRGAQLMAHRRQEFALEAGGLFELRAFPLELLVSLFQVNGREAYAIFELVI